MVEFVESFSSVISIWLIGLGLSMVMNLFRSGGRID